MIASMEFNRTGNYSTSRENTSPKDLLWGLFGFGSASSSSILTNNSQNASLANNGFYSSKNVTGSEYGFNIESLIWISTEGNPNFNEMLSSINALLDEEAEDDYGILRPTDNVIETAFQMLIDSSDQMAQLFPYGSISTDSEGGIRIEWNNKERDVRLVIPAIENKSPYIYYDSGETYGLEEIDSPFILTKWLGWLAGA